MGAAPKVIETIRCEVCHKITLPQTHDGVRWPLCKSCFSQIHSPEPDPVPEPPLVA